MPVDSPDEPDAEGAGDDEPDHREQVDARARAALLGEHADDRGAEQPATTMSATESRFEA